MIIVFILLPFLSCGSHRLTSWPILLIEGRGLWEWSPKSIEKPGKNSVYRVYSVQCVQCVQERRLSPLFSWYLSPKTSYFYLYLVYWFVFFKNWFYVSKQSLFDFYFLDAVWMLAKECRFKWVKKKQNNGWKGLLFGFFETELVYHRHPVRDLT